MNNDFKFKDVEKITTEFSIKKILRETNRNGIEDLITWLEDSDFFTAPASTFYHLACEGGLAFHSLSVYNVLKNKLTNNNVFGIIPDDTIAIVALLHDICKVNFYKKEIGRRKKKDSNEWEDYDKYIIDEELPLGHGEKSVILIQKFIELSEEEMLAIRWHMGAFDSELNQKNLIKAIEKYPLVLAMHEADFESAHIVEVKYVQDNS